MLKTVLFTLLSYGFTFTLQATPLGHQPQYCVATTQLITCWYEYHDGRRWHKTGQYQAQWPVPVRQRLTHLVPVSK